MTTYATAAEALEAYIVPENPMPGSDYHNHLQAELADVVTVAVRMTETGEIRYKATPRKYLDLYSVGSCWRENKKNGQSFVVVVTL